MDGGSEFISKDFEEFLNENNITPRYTNTGEKNNTAIVERMNRTIRDKIQTHFNLTETLKYYDIIENHELENTINNTYNRSIDEAPISLTNENIENNNKILRKSNTKKFKKLNLNIGDSVRIKLTKDKFEKAGNKYSKTIHKITDIYG
jgi:transposase InsO family protein